MANFENSLEESFLTLCEFRLRKSLESASNNDNKTPTASSVEQVISLVVTRSNKSLLPSSLKEPQILRS